MSYGDFDLPSVLVVSTLFGVVGLICYFYRNKRTPQIRLATETRSKQRIPANIAQQLCQLGDLSSGDNPGELAFQVMECTVEKDDKQDAQDKKCLDDELEQLSHDLGQKECEVRVSKTKFLEAQHVMDSLESIKSSQAAKTYNELLKRLRKDFETNEHECRNIQNQIEVITRKKAELHDEIVENDKIFIEAAIDLAANLEELQRGVKTCKKHANYMENKPNQQEHSCYRKFASENIL